MTDRIALGLALAIGAVAAANFWLGWELHLFVGRRLTEAIAWLAFWR